MRYGDAMSPSNFRYAMSIAVQVPLSSRHARPYPHSVTGGDAKNARSGLARVDLQVHCEVGIVPQYGFGIASAEQASVLQCSIEMSSKRGSSQEPHSPHDVRSGDHLYECSYSS